MAGSNGHPEIMTAEQVAAYLQIENVQTVYRMAKAEILPSFRLPTTGTGKRPRVRFRKVLIDAYIERASRGPTLAELQAR